MTKIIRLLFFIRLAVSGVQAFAALEPNLVYEGQTAPIHEVFHFAYFSKDLFAEPLSPDAIRKLLQSEENFERKERGARLRAIKGRYGLRFFILENRTTTRHSIVITDQLKSDSSLYLMGPQSSRQLAELSTIGSTWLLNLEPGRNYFVLETKYTFTQTFGHSLFTRAMDAEAAFHLLEKQTSLVTSISGAILAIAAYSVGLFFFFRRLYFLIYFVYVLAALYCFLVMYQVDLGSSGIFYLTAGLATSTLIAFSNSVLSLKKRSPLLFRLSHGIMMITIALAVAGYQTDRSLYTYLSSLIALLFCTASASVAAFQKLRPARYLLVGWLCFFTSIFLRALDMFYARTDNELLFYAPLFGFAVEVFFFNFAIGLKVRLSEEKAQTEKAHAFNQLAKVFYPHQIARIENQAELEDTMPTGPGEACVLSLDIIGSSQIKDEHVAEFFRDFFSLCSGIMMEGYDGENLRGNAYRIKQMGDGFLCSIGYPFASLSGNTAQDALSIAWRFMEALDATARKHDFHETICCGIGIAQDQIAGFYPESGALEYDLYGRGIILATRYESMRKMLPQATPDAHILILQERVYHSLDAQQRNSFTELDLHASGMIVRDDPEAGRLYYRLIPAQSAVNLGAAG